MSKTRDFKVNADQADLRIDKFLTNQNKDLSRSYIQELIKDNQITVNGKEVKKSYQVQIGDEIKLSFPQTKEVELQAEDIPLEVIYQDQDLIVINKQPDLVVHPTPHYQTGTLVHALLYHCDNLSGINGEIRPGIVHRLDKDTSGAIVAAKNDTAHVNLVRQFERRETKKIYQALVEGQVKYNQGKIDAAIGRDPKDRKKMAVTSKNSKKAVSKFKVLTRYQNYTLVEVEIKTGRTHQIRLHMDYMGHPVVGDQLYGSVENELGANRQLLHSTKLGFYHPRTEEWQEFAAPIWDDMERIVSKLDDKN
ncbi:RluA family pseudouridine synthase [Natroniella sulfidigena]|uniref:RluA family pseudouridine synthase n=1 Tax=Natroniella sulfidigena TaxID=723921 RepID=UPI00200A5FC7|nr:RluA family pseudouridine synthase [Natroniella sulfidigena]MCK8817797.1 RluA family pseudouridine synthase [Natroniella sulfidigena]